MINYIMNPQILNVTLSIGEAFLLHRIYCTFMAITTNSKQIIETGVR